MAGSLQNGGPEMAPKPPNVRDAPAEPSRPSRDGHRSPRWFPTSNARSRSAKIVSLLNAAGEGGKDREDVGGVEGGAGGRVEAVDERHALEGGGDAESAHDVAHGAAVGDLEDHRLVTTLGGQERDERGEESDFDLHLNPPCPSRSTDGRASATRRRSPGRI